MKITIKLVKEEFQKAEKNLESCWGLLVDLKTYSIAKNNFGERFITFQDKLAFTIFSLQSIRDQILLEEKKYVQNKSDYEFEWFKSKMRSLANLKKGIDSVVNIAKALGDAFAYFFYQFDLNLLSEHYSHQRIINNSAGMGERGELEFLKNVKHLDGHFTLFHGITNILRYGDFSFIDLKTMQVSQVGELKTKQTSVDTIDLKLTLVKKHKTIHENNSVKFENPELEKSRKGRQILGILNFLNEAEDPNKENASAKLHSNYYFSEVEKLIKQSKIKASSVIQVSEGLVFFCIKFKKKSLFNKIFGSSNINKSLISDNLTDIVNKIVKSNSNNNGFIIGQLLYNPDFTDKNTPGTVPVFWHPINHKFLKQLYFAECCVIPIFNPIHLIENLEELGFIVDSKYADNSKKDLNIRPKKVVEKFDLFLSYIMNFLFAESFVINCVTEVLNQKYEHPTTRIEMKLQQHIDIFDWEMQNSISKNS
jgi:hypothetical protein